MTAEAAVDWSKVQPRPCDHEMVGEEWGLDPTQWPASGDYNRDRARMARALECEYIEVRMRTIWMVWDPKEAATRWAEEINEGVMPTSLDQFWDELGWYCPWRVVKRGTPGAVKFRQAIDPEGGSDGR